MIRKFYIFLFGITVFRLIYALFLPVAPQEAYYWNYSRHPALSYFDHPPIAAYFIKLTTILGTSGFSIHLAAIVLSTIMTLVIFRLTVLLFDEKTAFWTAVSVNIAFIYALGSMIITPDTPMLLFWGLAMLACYKIDIGSDRIWWILLGVFLGAGFASKYTMVFAWLGAFSFFLFSRQRRHWLATIWPYLSLLSLIIVILPVLIWNYQHDWASFLFQTQRRAGEMSRFRPDFFFGFIGTVIGNYGIFPIPLLLVGIWNSLKGMVREKSANHSLLIWFSVPLIIFLFPISLKSWVKMNWTVPAFIGWFMAGVAFYHLKCGSSRLVRFWGKSSLVFLTITFLAVHILILLPGFHYGRGDYYSGWDQLADKVQSIRDTTPEPYFICGYEYKIASELAFHLDDHPETVSNNIVGRPGLQYDYWSDPDTLIGYNAIFIYDDRIKFSEADRLNLYFETVMPEEILSIKKGGKKVTDFHIFRCLNYLGNEGKIK